MVSRATKARRPTRISATALLQFLDTDRYMYRRKHAFVATVQRKLKAKRYDPDQAPWLWLHFVDEGATRLARTEGLDVRVAFPPADRYALARAIAEHELKKIERGKYPDLTEGGEQARSRGAVRRRLSAWPP